MKNISATKFRRGLFSYLKLVKEGESIMIELDGQQVAKLAPVIRLNWQARMKIKAKIKGDPQVAFAPMEDLFEGYV